MLARLSRAPCKKAVRGGNTTTSRIIPGRIPGTRRHALADGVPSLVKRHALTAGISGLPPVLGTLAPAPAPAPAMAAPRRGHGLEAFRSSSSVGRGYLMYAAFTEAVPGKGRAIRRVRVGK